MKVFLSWSGNISKEIAEELNKWIPTVLQSVKPYFSPSDIEKGAKWDSEISNNLSESTIGVICITPDNVNKPWILFEAGALSSKLDKSRVCPLLFELTNSDLTGPLATFQTTIFTKTEFKKLIQTINKQLAEHKVLDSIFEETFDIFFPKLEKKIGEIITRHKPSDHVETVQRSDREILEEILELTRRQYTVRSKKLSREVYLIKEWNQITESEKKIINDAILSYMNENGFRLKEHMLLDEDKVYEYLITKNEVRRAAGDPENLTRMIQSFINQ